MDHDGTSEIAVRFADEDPWADEAPWGWPLGPDGPRMRVEPLGLWHLGMMRNGEVMRGSKPDAEPTAVEVFVLTDEYAVLLPLEPDGDGIAVLHLELHRRDGRPLGSRDLGRLGLAAAYAALEVVLSDPVPAEHLGKRWGAVVTPKPGRRKRPDIFYASAALAYVRALEVNPKAPIKVLIEAAKERGEHASAAEIRARLVRARARGLLTESERGRAGGELTTKAIKVLTDAGLIEQTGDTHGKR